MDEQDLQYERRITAVESSLKSLHKRVDHIEELVESVHTMTGELQKMTVGLQHMRDDINKVSAKVDEIEKKPAKLWSTVVTAIISAIAGGAGTLIVTKLIGG